MPLSSEKAPASPNLIVLLTDNISEPFFAGFARQLGRRASVMGYRLVIGSTELIPTFRNMHPAAYIIALLPGRDLHLHQLMGEGKPVVVLGRHSVHPGAYTIGSDNFKGGYDATDHLIAKGHRDIVLFTTASRSQRLDERRRGYEAAMVGNALTPRVVRLPVAASVAEIGSAVGSIFQEQGKVDALLFVEHDLVMAGLDVLRRLKKKLPVIGFDDDGSLRLLAPFITTVAQPLDEMAQYVLQCIHGDAESVPEQSEGNEREGARDAAPTKFAGVGDSVVLSTRLVMGASMIKSKTNLLPVSSTVQ